MDLGDRSTPRQETLQELWEIHLAREEPAGLSSVPMEITEEVGGCGRRVVVEGC